MLVYGIQWTCSKFTCTGSAFDGQAVRGVLPLLGSGPRLRQGGAGLDLERIECKTLGLVILGPFTFRVFQAQWESSYKCTNAFWI